MKQGSAKNCGNGEKKSETPLPQRSDPSVVSGVEASLPLSLQKTPSSLDPANTKPTHPSTLLQILNKVCEKACKFQNRHTHTHTHTQNLASLFILKSCEKCILYEHFGGTTCEEIGSPQQPVLLHPLFIPHLAILLAPCSTLNAQCLFNSQCFFVVVVVVFLPTPTHGSIIFSPPHMHKS